MKRRCPALSPGFALRDGKAWMPFGTPFWERRAGQVRTKSAIGMLRGGASPRLPNALRTSSVLFQIVTAGGGPNAASLSAVAEVVNYVPT